MKKMWLIKEMEINDIFRKGLYTIFFYRLVSEFLEIGFEILFKHHKQC